MIKAFSMYRMNLFWLFFPRTISDFQKLQPINHMIISAGKIPQLRNHNDNRGPVPTRATGDPNMAANIGFDRGALVIDSITWLYLNILNEKVALYGV